MIAQLAITAPKGHPTHTTNPASQARTIPRQEETRHWIVCHVIQVSTAWAMEMTNLQTVAVLVSIALEEMSKLRQVPRAVRRVTTAHKDLTI